MEELQADNELVIKRIFLLFCLAFLICPATVNAALQDKQSVIAIPQPQELLQIPDPRVLAVSAFLDNHACGTSLEDFNIATVFVTEADKNNISPYILPAIWIAESTCGKHQLVNNGFGFMKPGGQTAGLKPFASTDDAIAYISHALTIAPYAKSSPQADISVYNGNPSYLVEFNALYAQQVVYEEGYTKLLPMVIVGTLSK